MKLKEIELLKEYAVGHADYPHKAIVTKVGLYREVCSHGSWRATTRSARPDGVEVCYVSMADGSLGDTEVIAQSQVRSTWAAEEERREAVQQRRFREQQRDMSYSKTANELKSLGLMHTRVEYGRNSGEPRGIVLDIAAAKKLVELLKAGGPLS
jgi:hypothetical protein